MEIQQTDNTENGMFYVEQSGEKLAKMYYSWRGTDRIIISHTEVDDRLRGTGAGKQMVTRAVEFAREKGIKIVPFEKKTGEFENEIVFVRSVSNQQSRPCAVPARCAWDVHCAPSGGASCA